MKKNTYPTMLWFILMLNVPAISYACYYVKEVITAVFSRTEAQDDSDDDAMPDSPNFYQHGASAYKSMQAAEKAQNVAQSASQNSAKAPQKPSAPQAASAEATALLGKKSEKK